MMTLEYITNYLRLNGIAADLSSNDLSQALTHVGWSEEDSLEAFRILHGEAQTEHTQDADKILYSDATLTPHAVTSLLNIHIQHRPRTGVPLSQNTKHRYAPSDFTHTVVAVGVAVIVAGITFTAALFFMKMGPFYG